MVGMLHILRETSEGLDELDFVSVFRLLLLENMIEVVLAFLVFRFGGVDGIHEYLGVVHGAPANKAPVVVEGLELVLLDVAIDGLLDVKIALHPETEAAIKYILILRRLRLLGLYPITILISDCYRLLAILIYASYQLLLLLLVCRRNLLLFFLLFLPGLFAG